MEALKTLGFDVNKLYKMSLKEYINQNPDIRALGMDIQQRRYSHHEDKRLEKINRAIERRRQIIANPDKIFTKVIK